MSVRYKGEQVVIVDVAHDERVNVVLLGHTYPVPVQYKISDVAGTWSEYVNPSDLEYTA